MGITGNHEPDQGPAGTAYGTTWLEYLQRLIDTVPLGPRGIRWLRLPDAVLRQAERDWDPPYDEFVSRVDIATVGRCFDGVLGSAIEVLHRRPDGRTTLQLERVTVTPEAIPGADTPETHWLERIDYGTDEQRMWIRTVRGSSTLQYDGYVAFARAAGQTRIVFLACRRLPASRLVRLNRWPWLTGILVQRAFRRFFDVTTANILASYHGERRP